jgi:hypothetical protein
MPERENTDPSRSKSIVHLADFDQGWHTMELREFITATLVEIQSGVQDAINYAVEHGMKGAINPSFDPRKDKGLVEKVQFDIAVTVGEKKTGSAEGGIKVVGINLGGTTGGSHETSHVSRIQFSIPLIPPTTNVIPEPAKK